MKRQRIRTLGIICIIVLAMAVVSGCSQGKAEQSEEQLEQAPVISQEAEPEKDEMEQNEPEHTGLEQGKMPVLEEKQAGQAEQTEKTEEEEEAAEEPDLLPESVTEESEQTELSEPEQQIDFVIANVNTSLNIRQEPSTEGEILGKLYRGARATILERGPEWTYITSGSVTGYVANDYLMFDEEALLGAEEYGVTWVTVEADTLRIRQEPSTDAKVLDLVAKGSRLIGAPDGEEVDGWVAIDFSDDDIGYVSAEYVSVTVELEEAISIEEEQRQREEQRLAEERAAQAAREAEKKAAQEAKAAQAALEAKKTTEGITNRAAFSLSEEEIYLLAGVVHMEAGNQSYEGKLAVANVVLNRLLSKRWGSTLESVVYAKGQFSGANTGVLQGFLDQGPNKGSLKAAAEAAAGVNNIGDYLAFCANRAAKYDTYKAYTIIDGHTFYKR